MYFECSPILYNYCKSEFVSFDVHIYFLISFNSGVTSASNLVRPLRSDIVSDAGAKARLFSLLEERTSAPAVGARDHCYFDFNYLFENEGQRRISTDRNIVCVREPIGLEKFIGRIILHNLGAVC